MIRRIFFLLTFLASVSAKAQIFGGNPSSIKWNQINTDTVRIIFPRGLDTTAQRVANVIHAVQKNHTAPIGERLQKISIVLQNQSTVANAYVGLAPYRSEFYLFAPQNSFDLGSLNWVDLLSLHEYRHVQQFNNFNVGVTKVIGTLLGQEARAVANAAAVPDWFFEGDAVFNETVLSESGRGRIPDFFNGYQSLMRSNLNYSYMKLRNGSFKDFVPDHYALGYLLVSYGREKYGIDFWRKVSQDAARFKPLFYPWQGAVKKHSGIGYKQFVTDAIGFYHNKWHQKKQENLQYITRKNSYPTNYKYPYAAANHSFIVLKRSFREVPAFYKIYADGGEKKLKIRGIAYDDYFSYKNGKIIYTYLKPHARWGYKEYGNLRLVDVETGAEKDITNNGRYFSADISNSGEKVVAVEMASNQTNSLVMLDLSGRKLSLVSRNDGSVFTYLKFSTNDQFIYTAVRNGSGQMALQKYDATALSKTPVNILPFKNRIIGFPTVQGDTVLFSSSYKGSDEIWAYIESSNAVYRVASTPLGFYQATANGNGIVASTFTSEGYRLVSIPAAELLWQKLDNDEDVLPDLYVQNALKQEENLTLQNVGSRKFLVSKYSKAYRLINFHSLRPYYDHPEISVTLAGQNILNTLQTEVSYTYNRNEGSSKLGANLIYGGWFVQPSVGVNQTWNRTVILNTDTAFLFNELTGSAGLTLPLNLSGAKQFRYLTLNTSVNTQQITLPGVAKRFFQEKDFNFWQTQLSYRSSMQKSVQQIYPRWAQSVFARYRTIINKYSAHQLLLSGSVFLPGLHNNHSLVLTAALHARDTLNQHYFGNSFPFSRGYRSVDFPRSWVMGANYHFPLFYPDFGFANIVYFQRVRTNTFYDYTVGKSLRTGATFPFRSAGAEIFFDTRWWNQQQVSFGIQYSRLLNNEFRGITNPNYWQFILPINLF